MKMSEFSLKKLLPKNKKQNAVNIDEGFSTKMNFVVTEQYKRLRTNIEFTLPDGLKCPVIGVTSPNRGEGKSTTSVNLSYVMAQSEKRVLLIDGDLRIPTVATKLGLENTVGLTDLLMKKKPADSSSLKSGVLDNWCVITSGELPPNPSELLASDRMKSLLDRLREIFDLIIIDLPPVNIVSDAVAISKYLDGMIVVCMEGYTAGRELDACLSQLELADANILGIVTNEVGKTSDAYYYSKYGRNYKQYSKYYKYGYEKAGTENEKETK